MTSRWLHAHIWKEGKCACGKRQCIAKSHTSHAIRTGGRCQLARAYEDGTCGVHHKREWEKA